MRENHAVFLGKKYRFPRVGGGGINIRFRPKYRPLYQSEARLWPIGYSTSTALLWASTTALWASAFLHSSILRLHSSWILTLMRIRIRFLILLLVRIWRLKKMCIRIRIRNIGNVPIVGSYGTVTNRIYENPKPWFTFKILFFFILGAGASRYWGRADSAHASGDQGGLHHLQGGEERLLHQEGGGRPYGCHNFPRTGTHNYMTAP
jgi:hypothetical protein